MNKYLLRQCVVGAYVRFYRKYKAGICAKGFKTDKHKIYKIENTTVSTMENDVTVIYALQEIHTKNIRFVTTKQLKKNFILAKSANILFGKTL